MRKHLLFSILLFVSVAVFAQQGSTLVYGNFYYQRSKSKMDAGGDATWSWSLSPGIGYQVAPKWTAGLNLVYGEFKNASKTTTIGAGPFVRYTASLSDIFSIFGQLEGGYTVHDRKDNPNYSTFRMSLFPAIEMNLKNGFALNFGMGAIDYTSSRSDDLLGNYNTFSISLGSAATVGVSKRFGGKQ